MSPPSGSTVFLQDWICSQARAAKDPTGHAAVELVSRESVNLLAQLGHQCLSGSGLRDSNLGAVVVSVGPGLSMRASEVGDAVVDQLGLPGSHMSGFGGVLSMYHALFFATAAIDDGHFENVLLLHLAGVDEDHQIRLTGSGTLLGRTPGHLRFLKVRFGRLSQADAPLEPAVRQAFADVKLEALRSSDDVADQGARALFDLATHGNPQSTAVVAGRDDGRWAAAAFTVATAPTLPAHWDNSVQAHLRRASVGGFPVSLLRIAVDGVERMGKQRALFLDEVHRDLKGSVRAFDAVVPLADGSMLVVLPRMSSSNLKRAQERLMNAVRDVDLAGELSFEPKVKSVTVEASQALSPGDIEQALGARLTAAG